MTKLQSLQWRSTRTALVVPVVLCCFALVGCPSSTVITEGDSGPAIDGGGDGGPRDSGTDSGPALDAGCAATEYRTATGCMALTTCTTDEYESTAPTATSDRVCTALTTCTTDEYESAAPTATTDRVCTALTVCMPGEYESTAATPTTDRACLAWTTCMVTEYETVAPTATSDRVCTALTVCASTEYETMAPTATTDRVCTALTVCASTEYETTAPTATTDRACTALTVCTASQYESVAPTATTDRTCASLTVCTATQQQITAPTATSDRVCGACGAGTGNCDLDVANGCEVNLSTSDTNCGMCGMGCALDQTCGGGTCGLCTPVVVTVPESTVPGSFAGESPRCMADAGPSGAGDCDVVQCGRLTTWAFSYFDNRFSFDVVTFTPSGTVVRRTERGGSRYWWNSTVNAATQTATFLGQGGSSVTIPWSELRL